jgi:protein-tyrosine phosphatase
MLHSDQINERGSESSLFLLKQFVKGSVREVYWRIHGRSIENPIMPDAPESFLFICKGNICRSPFAERLAAKMIADYKLDGTKCFSAGLEVSKSLPSPPEAIFAAKRYGVHLGDHRSENITLSLVEANDMILAMETSQFIRLRNSFPQFRDKIYLLPLFEKDRKSMGQTFLRYNVPDPYGKSPEYFLHCYNRIEQCLKFLFIEIIRQGNK